MKLQQTAADGYEAKKQSPVMLYCPLEVNYLNYSPYARASGHALNTAVIKKKKS